MCVRARVCACICQSNAKLATSSILCLSDSSVVSQATYPPELNDDTENVGVTAAACAAGEGLPIAAAARAVVVAVCAAADTECGCPCCPSDDGQPSALPGVKAAALTPAPAAAGVLEATDRCTPVVSTVGKEAAATHAASCAAAARS